MADHGSMETDRQALLSLPMTTMFRSRYPSWNPANWDLHTWEDGTDDAKLDLNSEGRVLKLIIGGVEMSWIALQGEISSKLCTLSLLVELDLSRNELIGSIPPELAKLKMLKILRLSINKLTGSIPRELGNLTALEYLDLGHNKLSGSIPRELGNLTALEYLDLGLNKLSGPIPVELSDLQNLYSVDLAETDLTGRQVNIYFERGRVLRWQQALKGATSRSSKPWASQAIDGIIAFWHFLVPVIDDYTDVILLWVTFGDGTLGLWWICAIAMVLAELDRIYIAVTPIILLLFWILKFLGECLRSCDMNWLDNFIVDIELSGALGLGDTAFNYGSTKMLVLDAILWVLLGSRARSSDMMAEFGMAGEAPSQISEDAGLTVRAIDRLLYWNPYRCLGEFMFQWPYGHRINRQGGGAKRRADAMVKAVGETLVVDPLFLALGISASGWDGSFTGAAAISTLFSILELLTEFQHYASMSLSYMEATVEMEGPQRAPSARGTATIAQQIDQNVSGDRQV